MGVGMGVRDAREVRHAKSEIEKMPKQSRLHNNDLGLT
jgi:hypothetical protein